MIGSKNDKPVRKDPKDSKTIHLSEKHLIKNSRYMRKIFRFYKQRMKYNIRFIDQKMANEVVNPEKKLVMSMYYE